jgi:hypothetical protein
MTAPAGSVLSAAVFELRFNADSRLTTEHGGMAPSEERISNVPSATGARESRADTTVFGRRLQPQPDHT